MNKENYQAVNSAVIDRWVAEGWEWGKPIDHETYLRAKAGEWDVLLTPTKAVPHEWFGDLAGKRVLGLASGGGQQIPVFTALGARCTVLDYSAAQLESERMVAAREDYAVECVQADMTKPLPFADASFDLIFHPVSNCYVEQLDPIWRECARVLKPGGVLLVGFDNGFNYLFDDDWKIRYKLPFNPLQDEALYKASLENDDGIQFSHTIEEEIGGQLRAGFMLTDIYQDTNGYGLLEEYNVPTFYATRCVKKMRKRRRPRRTAKTRCTAGKRLCAVFFRCFRGKKFLKIEEEKTRDKKRKQKKTGDCALWIKKREKMC